MQPTDTTTSSSLPAALCLIGVACSLRLQRGPLQHRVELFCLQSGERVRVYGRATTRENSMLVQFHSCLKPDGQLERHTEHVPITESSLLCYIMANWHFLLQGPQVATSLPAVLTFEVETKKPVSFEGVATYVGGNSMPVLLQFTRS